jgi:hypothetical protein
MAQKQNRLSDANEYSDLSPHSNPTSVAILVRSRSSRPFVKSLMCVEAAASHPRIAFGPLERLGGSTNSLCRANQKGTMRESDSQIGEHFQNFSEETHEKNGSSPAGGLYHRGSRIRTDEN